MVHTPTPELRWRVSPTTVSPEGDELTLDIDGEELFIHAQGARLCDVVEAWGTALCVPAARVGATVVLPRQPDPTWLAGAQANVRDMAAWWGGDDQAALEWPATPWPRRLAARLRPPQPPTASQGRALCFTAGVDSFFSLLAGDHRPTHLLFVHGFDIDLDDTQRRAGATDAIRAVAEARGLTAIEVETNLRHHHCFDQASWEHTHGAALACISLALSSDIGAVVIPPSYSPDRMVPWGSRPDLDPRWSVPGRLSVGHGNALVHRTERIAAIADEPLVHAHLRVCWAHLTDDLNCGRCEKCIRTMLAIEALGRLQECTTFPGVADLAEALDAMDDPPASIRPLWEDLRSPSLRPEILAALDRLTARATG